MDTSDQRIVPAIIPQSREHLIESLEKIAPFTDTVQIDIVDGIFVPPRSWPYTHKENPLDLRPIIDGFSTEVDLMIQNPEEVLEQYLKAGVKRVVVHLESTQALDAILALKEKYPFELGLSILNDTDVQVLLAQIHHADYVQLMGIAEIGSQGVPFDIRVVERIRTLKAEFPDLMISIDGSVNKETLPLLKEAGADRFAVGSAILSADDPEGAYRELDAIIAS